jgi:hypothetical protein
MGEAPNPTSDRVIRLRETIRARLPESRLTPFSPERLDELRAEYTDIPEHLLLLLELVGEGTIGRGRYAIFGLLGPGEVYDPATAAELAGVVLVGHDFGEYVAAYDTRAGWRFGEVGERCRFEPHDEHPDFVAFLQSWVLR